MEKSSNSSKIVGDAFRGPSGYETVDEQPLPETRGRVLGLGLLAAAVILCAVVFVAVPSPSSGAGANTHGLAMRCVDNSARVVPRPRTVRLPAAATAPPQVPHVEPRRRLLPVEFGEEPRLLPGRHEHRDGDEDRQGRVRRQQRLRGPVWKPNLQSDFNVSVFECFDTSSSAGLRELDESDRSVQKSAESTSI